MSSKRKNTPTKIAVSSAAEELFHQHKGSMPTENGSEGDSPMDSDMSDNESSLSLATTHMDTNPHFVATATGQFVGSDTEDRDSAGSPGSDHPQTKKQRLLQSVSSNHDNESFSNGNDSASELTTVNNNNILAKNRLLHNKSSVDHMLHRLNHKMADGIAEAIANGTSEGDVMSHIQAQLTAVDNVEDKQQKLNDMIAQLQTLKETLANNNNGVSFVFYLNLIS